MDTKDAAQLVLAIVTLTATVMAPLIQGMYQRHHLKAEQRAAEMLGRSVHDIVCLLDGPLCREMTDLYLSKVEETHFLYFRAPGITDGLSKAKFAVGSSYVAYARAVLDGYAPEGDWSVIVDKQIELAAREMMINRCEEAAYVEGERDAA
jgi:hypothetical protein